MTQRIDTVEQTAAIVACHNRFAIPSGECGEPEAEFLGAELPQLTTMTGFEILAT